VDRLTNRLPPKDYTNFVSYSLAMKVYYNQTPANLRRTIVSNTYVKTRYLGRLFGFDSSKTQCGGQAMKNWIGQNLNQIREDWTANTRSSDSIRVLLKKYFY